MLSAMYGKRLSYEQFFRALEKDEGWVISEWIHEVHAIRDGGIKGPRAGCFIPFRGLTCLDLPTVMPVPTDKAVAYLCEVRPYLEHLASGFRSEDFCSAALFLLREKPGNVGSKKVWAESDLLDFRKSRKELTAILDRSSALFTMTVDPADPLIVESVEYLRGLSLVLPPGNQELVEKEKVRWGRPRFQRPDPERETTIPRTCRTRGHPLHAEVPLHPGGRVPGHRSDPVRYHPLNHRHSFARNRHPVHRGRPQAVDLSLQGSGCHPVQGGAADYSLGMRGPDSESGYQFPDYEGGYRSHQHPLFQAVRLGRETVGVRVQEILASKNRAGHDGSIELMLAPAGEVTAGTKRSEADMVARRIHSIVRGLTARCVRRTAGPDLHTKAGPLW